MPHKESKKEKKLREAAELARQREIQRQHEAKASERAICRCCGKPNQEIKNIDLKNFQSTFTFESLVETTSGLPAGIASQNIIDFCAGRPITMGTIYFAEGFYIRKILEKFICHICFQFFAQPFSHAFSDAHAYAQKEYNTFIHLRTLPKVGAELAHLVQLDSLHQQEVLERARQLQIQAQASAQEYAIRAARLRAEFVQGIANFQGLPRLADLGVAPQPLAHSDFPLSVAMRQLAIHQLPPPPPPPPPLLMSPSFASAVAPRLRSASTAAGIPQFRSAGAAPRLQQSTSDLPAGCMRIFADVTSACQICLEPASENPVALQTCGHVFHLACIKRWFETGSGCPTCRHT